MPCVAITVAVTILRLKQFHRSPRPSQRHCALTPCKLYSNQSRICLFHGCDCEGDHLDSLQKKITLLL